MAAIVRHLHPMDPAGCRYIDRKSNHLNHLTYPRYPRNPTYIQSPTNSLSLAPSQNMGPHLPRRHSQFIRTFWFSHFLTFSSSLRRGLSSLQHLLWCTSYTTAFCNMFSPFSTRGQLRRSMSSRSIRKSRRPPTTEIIDPNVAKLHAAAAASRAMHSGQKHSQQRSAELKCSYDQLGGPAQVAIPKRRPKSKLQYIDDSASTCGVPTVPPSTPLSFIEAESRGKLNARDCSAVLSSTGELNGLDGRDSSVPSSYRRLRKAKSMFSTRQRLSHITYGTPPLPRRDAMDIERSPQFVLPRTMRHTPSFTRTSPFPGSGAIRRAKSQDTAIQLAHNQFLEDIDGVDGAEIQTRRSSLFLHRRRKENRSFRKTFRATSESSIGAKFQGDHSHCRRRTFSASFKNGLKRVFGLSKPVEQQSRLSDEAGPPLPPVPTTVDDDTIENTISEYVDVDDDPPSSPLRVPRITPSRASLCTSKSRVTSWADSTVANTITARKNGHRQSLPLIEEHGDLNQELPQHPSGPVDQASPKPGKSAARRFNDWVDSHDLYSALMQQIGRQGIQNSEEEIIFGTVPEHHAIPARTSSAFSRRSKLTIRRVPSGDSSTPGSFTTAKAENYSSPQKHFIRPLQYIPSPRMSRIPGQENQPLDARVDGKSPLSPYSRDGDSDDETGSVIVVQYGNSRMGPVSPSVYSRTTNGGTPTKDGAGPRRAAEEPGTATIFASQRAVYRSPTRSPSSSPLKTQVQPSSDWQQWMSSQIERIESASPTREHIREDAQFQEDDDDDDEIFMGIMRRAPVPGQESTAMPYIASGLKHHDPQPIEELKVASQNNFSRPFSRSSSVRTILPSQNVEPGSTVKTASKLSAVDMTAEDPSPPVRVPSGRTLSPMRTRTGNQPGLPDSPTPGRLAPDMSKRNLTQEQYRRYSARRPMANGKPNSFRSMRTYRDFNALNNENAWQKVDHDNMMGEYHKLQDGHSTISSRHMVETFLNSRRRPAETDALENDNPGEVFI